MAYISVRGNHLNPEFLVLSLLPSGLELSKVLNSRFKTSDFFWDRIWKQSLKIWCSSLFLEEKIKMFCVFFKSDIQTKKCLFDADTVFFNLK